MNPLPLHEFHDGLNARFGEVNRCEVVNDYGDVAAEHAALHNAAGALDLSFRGRIVLTGADRVRLLNGQVTNNVKDLRTGQGCYAALVTAKGKLESDLNIYALANELLLDFEPGLTAAITQRLEKYIIADDVQVVDAAPHYGLLSVQGPKAQSVVLALGLLPEHPVNPGLHANLLTPHPTLSPLRGEGEEPQASGSRPLSKSDQNGMLPAKPFQFVSINDPTLGEIYVMNHPRTGTNGFDLFVPVPALGAVMDKLIAAAKDAGGRACGWRALEMARIEAGIPRFGADMDDTNLAPEAGIEERAISYSKGCYIGQEVIARIRTYGQVTKALRGLRLADDLKTLPVKGDKLFRDGKEVGYITSALASPALKANIALGYVRKEVNQVGTELILKTGQEESAVKIAEVW